MQPIPLYNSAKHKAGDTVLMIIDGRKVQTKIPELDGDGHPIPE